MKNLNNTHEAIRQFAHDLRSPLDAINMAVDNMESNQEDAKVILKMAVERLMAMAEEVLSETRKTEVKSNAVAVINQIVTEKSAVIKEKGINIAIEANISNGDIELDKTSFSRMLSNILNNSIEAFENNLGKIIIKVKKVAKSLKVEIIDNGKGIPKNILPKILNENISFGKKNGNGLGIKHAKHTIESLNGKFGINSKIGEGTIVTFSLPLV